MDIKERAGGSNSVVESQPSKLLVAGSIPVSRSRFSLAASQVMAVFGDGCFIAPVYLERDTGRCSSAVERVLGKDEVTGSSPVIGSTPDLYEDRRAWRKKNLIGRNRM